MQRLPNWPEKLAAYIESRRDQPFLFGRNDCALFSADGILEMTGIDIAARWRGYKDERGAARVIRKAGGLRAIAMAAGLIEKNVGLAQRGDLVIAPLNDRDTFGLVVDRDWCGPGATYLEFRPMAEVVMVFAV